MSNSLHSPLHNDLAFDAVYSKQNVLGSGNFAEVFLCTHISDGTQHAVKIIDKQAFSEAKYVDMFTVEIEAMSTVRHPNIVELRETFEDETHFYLVMELIQGGELFEKIVEMGRYSEADAARVFRDLILAVSACHEHNFIHRDIKPENLLLSDDTEDATLKLADLGLAHKVMGDQKANMPLGTPNYLAPEILAVLDEDATEDTGYLYEVDLWSSGVVLYILLCGFPPFSAEDNDDLYDLIEAGAFTFRAPYWDNISDEAKDLVTGLLTVDPSRRLTGQQVLDHPWMKGAAPETHLETAQTELAKFNARRKFRSAVLAVKATNMFSRLARLKK